MDSAFELNAGRLCLDFTNTVRARPLSDKIDLINDYNSLLSWARQATILTNICFQIVKLGRVDP